jgi:hypothetical protein
MAEMLTYHCAYCGSLQQWDGTGTAVCAKCGATQPAKTVTPDASKPSRLQTLIVPIILGTLILFGAVLYFVLRTPQPSASKPAPIIDGRTASKATSPVPGSRIIRVENPHIRIIPAGVDFKPEDVIDTPEGTSSLSSFDTRLLQVQTPRRLRDEAGKPVFLGEVTNTSPNMVAVSPTVTLVLTRGGKTIDKATRSFADLVPGAHVPVFFRYDGATKAFDGMTFQWSSIKSYTLGDAKHARLITSVESHKQMTADEAIGHKSEYKYICERVNGKIVNEGQRDVRQVSVYVVLRDGKGQITGFDHDNITSMSPGESRSIQLTPVVLGEPVVSVEMVALPMSPPSL